MSRPDKSMRGPKALLTLILVLVTVAYPFLVFWGLNHFDTRILALMLLAVFLVRLLIVRGNIRRQLGSALPLVLVAGGICLLVLWRDDPRFFLYYPVLVNLILLGVFGRTLIRPPSMIERFARITEPDLPEVAIGYCRRVTIIWCGFFIINGGISLTTALSGSMKAWTLYNGLISYLLMGLLFAVEYAVRLVFKRRHTGDE